MLSGVMRNAFISPPSITIYANNIMVVPTRKFLSLNKSISSNGTLPFLFLLISNNAKTARTIRPTIIADMLKVVSSVSIKIPITNTQEVFP